MPRIFVGSILRSRPSEKLDTLLNGKNSVDFFLCNFDNKFNRDSDGWFSRGDQKAVVFVKNS